MGRRKVSRNISAFNLLHITITSDKYLRPPRAPEEIEKYNKLLCIVHKNNPEYSPKMGGIICTEGILWEKLL